MNGCEGLACRQLKDVKSVVNGLMQENEHLRAALTDVKTSLKLGNTIAAYQTAEKALSEVRQ